MGRYDNFMTQGQTKCSYCGDYYPSGWAQHGCLEELEAMFEKEDQ